MKKLFIGICLISLYTYVHAQSGDAALAKQAIAIKSIDPAIHDYTDLSALQKAIGNSRIVMLGEQTHGEGTTFLAKTRIIQYLHEQLGFEVLAFESGLYDVTKIWNNTQAGASFKAEVPGSLFYMYATSQQMFPLFDYIQAQLKGPKPLLIAGFESQHSGNKAKKEMFPDFEAFLQKQSPATLDSNWHLFRRLSEATFASRDFRPSATEQTTFLQELQQLKQLLHDNSSTVKTNFLQDKSFWYQVVCSIESQSKRYWQLVEGNEINVRDKQMAENIIWLADRAYPGKKIIIWAHNGHIANSTGKIAGNGALQQFYNTFIPMGNTLRSHFGKNVYALGFSGSEGKYMDYVSMKIVEVPAPKLKSIEAALAAKPFQYALLNYRKAKSPLDREQTGCIGDFMPGQAVWLNVFDGLFFIRKSIPVDR
ncbi:MAG: erythromycin esterase family protein [Chitinophaga sp.]|uniref:erythromycin esterase family protein n=1 Tax=Chitinophaga sp. TaxID=1869181 RepID=UPI0025C136C6|nr:erythromycin esterase family protein [Chitinophaga sp.]MBV8254309.1 erythromycin esterase family protein [Chitinophaga sp.]